jgi:homoserine dehydrogenase
VPEQLHAGPHWLFEARGKAGLPLFSASEQGLAGDAIAERLVNIWLEQLTREIWHA